MNPILEPLSHRLLIREGNICDTLQQAYNMGMQDSQLLADYKALNEKYTDLKDRYNDLLLNNCD